jgi:hypothetical protein
MFPLSFWKSWPGTPRRFFGLFALVSLLALVFMGIAAYQSPEPVFTPRPYQLLETAEFSTHTFHVGAVVRTVPAEAYLIFERLQGGDLKPNVLASDIFLILLVLGITLLLTVVTTLGRFWFYAGMLLVVLLIVSLRLEAVGLFGLQTKLPTAVLLLLVGLPSYYFQFLNARVAFGSRLLLFAAIFFSAAVVLGTAAQTPQPFLHLAANGVLSATILSIAFIFMIAHEIPATMVVMVSQGTRQRKSLQHFLIVTALYLAMLGLLYADRKQIFRWNLLPINLFVLAAASGIAGLWGFRRREPQYEEILEANPRGIFFYLGLAGIGFGTIGYFLATANDPLIHLAQDAILYSHLGYGLIFFVYVITNFGAMLSENMPVYRVLYKPTAMPYFTFRLAGLIATFSFFALSNWRVSVDQVYAGYYNATGDAFAVSDTSSAAEGYYHRSLLHAIRNYHAHYALAGRYAARNEPQKERDEYQKLVDSRPLDLAYLNLSASYEQEDALHRSVATLLEGLRDFPKNARIENELGILLSQLKVKDSAWLAVRQAISGGLRKQGQTNLAALAARFALRFPADSLFRRWGPGTMGLKTNLLALGCLQGTDVEATADDPTDTSLTTYSALFRHNDLLNHLAHPDTARISEAVTLARKTSNPYFRDFLLPSAAYACYAAGEVTRAIGLMRESAFTSRQAKYYDVLGLWALEQNAPGVALPYFDEALRQDYAPSRFNRALALTESGNNDEAKTAWRQLQHDPDSLVSATAHTMLSVLTSSPAELLQQPEGNRYLYCRYRIALDNQVEFERVVNTLRNPDVLARTLLDRSHKFDEADEPEEAAEMLKLASGLTLRDSVLYQEIIHLDLLLLARAGKWEALSHRMKSGVSFAGPYATHKIYFNAQLEAVAGTTKQAKQKFSYLADINPFFEDAVVASIDSLARDSPNKLPLYSTLVNSLELNPNSIKLLKAYLLMSIQLEFEENAQTSLDKLKTLMSPSAFLEFVRHHHETMILRPD